MTTRARAFYLLKNRINPILSDFLNPILSDFLKSDPQLYIYNDTYMPQILESFNVSPTHAYLKYHLLNICMPQTHDNYYDVRPGIFFVASTGKYLNYCTRLKFHKPYAASICSKWKEYCSVPPQAKIFEIMYPSCVPQALRSISMP